METVIVVMFTMVVCIFIGVLLTLRAKNSDKSQLPDPSQVILPINVEDAMRAYDSHIPVGTLFGRPYKEVLQEHIMDVGLDPSDPSVVQLMHWVAEDLKNAQIHAKNSDISSYIYELEEKVSRLEKQLKNG